MSRPTSVLVVTAAPDRRPSTARLHHLVQAMARRPDVRVTVWFLRCAWNERPWHDGWVVDRLRTVPGTRALEGVGLTIGADVIRGRLLRRRWAAVDPDLVVLDDALGERVIPGDVRRPPVVVRRNPEPPADAGLEEVAAQWDAELVAPGVEPVVGRPHLVEHVSRDGWDAVRRMGAPERRREVRHRLGLPEGGAVVCGWGEDGWLDGPDVFLRVLWAVRRLGVEVTGAWFGLTSDADEVRRLAEEAQRCGVGDRFVHLDGGPIGDRVCGDVVVLPYRSDADAEELLTAVAAGTPVVTFPATSLDDPDVHVVASLDVVAAARAVASVLAEDRLVRWSAALRRLDTQALVDDLVSLARVGS